LSVLITFLTECGLQDDFAARARMMKRIEQEAKIYRHHDGIRPGSNPQGALSSRTR